MQEAVQPDRPADGRATTTARRKLLIGRSEDLDRHLLGVRSSLIESMIRGLLAIVLLILPLSLARSFAIGWLPFHSALVALGLATVLLFLARRQLADRIKAAVVVAIFWAVGLTTLLGLGLAGAGIWWLVISSLLVSVLYSVRAGLVAMGVVASAIAIVGAGFALDVLPLPVQSATYLRSWGSWATVLVAATVMPLIVFRAVAALNTATVALLKQTGEQRELIRELATHDELTGVPTFTLALDRLEQALRAIPRSGRKVGLLFIDLDGFKATNDSMGHEAGDAVLAAVARRLTLNLRAEDTVARIGGDEFLAIVSGAQSADEILRIARKLQGLLREPVEYRDVQLPVACSIGAAFATDNRISAEQLIRAADAAMYDAKRAGTNLARLAPPLIDSPPA